MNIDSTLDSCEGPGPVDDHRRVQRGTPFEWVMPHTYRKTVATMLDRRGLSARTMADQLGRARVSMTQDVYMGRRAVDQAAAVYWKASHHRNITMMTSRLPCYRSSSW